MKDILQTLKSREDFVCFDGVTEEEIVDAEKQLNVSFANDYKQYLMAFGAASGNGHEFTGICESKRLNVVSATIKAKDRISLELDGLYLLENPGIDRSFVWQSSKGELFLSDGTGKIKKLDMSFAEYVCQ